MGELHLSEPMQRYFLDLFSCCDDKKTGKIHVTRLVDVLKTGGANDDIILQITSICNLDSNSSYLNRKQFCSALKLLAAHQANLQINSDILASNQLEIPLPRLKWPQIQAINCEPSQTMTNRRGSRDPDDVSSDLIELRDSNEVGNDYREHVDATSSTDSEVDSETLSIGRNGSPGASSAASDSPTPTNSVQDRSWAVTSHWQGLVSEEQRQLLGTEEESSDRHSSEEDTEVTSEVWTITSEQRDYYTAQFRNLQPDLNALLPGSIARKFFEMSRLHVQELRKIWTLADVTKDGALSLEEFNIAMHLVVLRRNHIELPDVLPVQLVPGNETPLSVTPETEPILSPQTKDNAKEWTKFVESPTNSSISSPGPKPVNFDFQKAAVEKDPKILHPVALRLTPEVQVSGRSSTGGNGNEDLVGEVEEEQGATMEYVEMLVDVDSKPREGGSTTVMIQRPQPKKLLQYQLMGMVPGALPPPPNNIAMSNNNQPQQAPNSMPSIDGPDGPVSLPAFPPPNNKNTKESKQPPPPPPRPFKTHGRSSSLDLNRLNKTNNSSSNAQNNKLADNQQQQGQVGQAGQLPPPTVPPRVSPNAANCAGNGNGGVSISGNTRRQQMISQRSEGSSVGMMLDAGRARDHKLMNEQMSTEFANFDAKFEQYENISDDQHEGIFPGDKYEADRRKLFAQFTLSQQPQPNTTTTSEDDNQQSNVTTSEQTDLPPPRKHGAFEIYRKPTPKLSRELSPAPTAGAVVAIPVSGQEELGQYEQFLRLQEQNTVLLRLCQELSQELADVREQKMTLKVRLERQQQQQKDNKSGVSSTASSRSANNNGGGAAATSGGAGASGAGGG